MAWQSLRATQQAHDIRRRGQRTDWPKARTMYRFWMEWKQTSLQGICSSLANGKIMAWKQTSVQGIYSSRKNYDKECAAKAKPPVDQQEMLQHPLQCAPSVPNYWTFQLF